MTLTDSDIEIVEFTVRCKMRRRWAKQFLGMLGLMQRLGSQGSSREVTIFADGDGDFRPKFDWDRFPDLDPAEPAQPSSRCFFFDAG